MPKVNFKSYLEKPAPVPPQSQLELIVAEYGPYLTLDEFARCLKIKRTIAYGLLKARQVTHTRTSGKSGCYRIAAVDIVRYIEKNAVKTAG